ncbi:MAG: DUF6141 family protein [Deltaproteobacteria bacterium]|nr:DUF6141 family protein [Deltaproteobacteria bacterium]
MDEQTGVIFQESQKFSHTFVWMGVIIVFLVFAGLTGYDLAIHLAMRPPFAGKTIPHSALMIMGIAQILTILFIFGILYTAQLMTEVRTDGLYIRFKPFHASYRRFGFESLKTYTACTYRPIMDYGGYGIHRGWKGWAYNVSGNSGVQIDLVNGKKIMIGSQKSEELVHALDIAAGGRRTP